MGEMISQSCADSSDSVKRHLSRRHLGLFLGGCTCESKIALSLEWHLVPHGSSMETQTQGFLALCFDAAPHLEYSSNVSSSASQRHLLKEHLSALRPSRVKIM